MKHFWYAYSFQMNETIRKKGFIISTLIMIGIIFAISFYNHYQDTAVHEKGVITVWDDTSLYQLDEKAFNQAMGDTYKIEFITSDESSIQKEVKNGTLDIVYVLGDADGLPTIQNYFRSNSNQAVSFWLEQHVKEQYILHVAKENEIADKAIDDLFMPIQTAYLQQTDNERSFGLVYPLVFAMYLFIMGFGQSIAINVVSEKSSKVMEVLLPKIHPIYSLYAKIFAALTTGLMQFGILILSFWVTIQIGWNQGDSLSIVGFDVSLKDMNAESLLWFVFFFVTGFLFYGLLYAAIGSMVTKVEDLSPVLTPLVFLLMGAFGIGMYSIFEPTSTLSVVSSYIPPFTPVVLFARILLGEATSIEIATSLGIFAMVFAVITYFCQKWYKQGVSGSHTFKKKKRNA